MVQVQDLHHRFDDRWILSGIDFTAEEGEIIAIMGSSGGGKTTLLRCISGLIRPSTGSVIIDGINVQKDPEGARRRMGMVFQSAALFDFMNVRDNVLFGIERHLNLKPKEREKTAQEALERVGLSEEDAGKMPADLSGGMRKRVGIARALALSPHVMLYDEPTTGLDPITTYHIDTLMVGIRNERRMTSLLVSHDVTSATRVADRIAFLHHGSLIFEGPPAEFEKSNLSAIRELIDKARATTLKEIG